MKSRRLALALAAGALLSATAATPAAALQFQDFHFTNFKAPGVAGAVALFRTTNGQARLAYSLVHASANADLRLVFNNRRCRKHGMALYERTIHTDANGAAFLNSADADATAGFSARSIRLFSGDNQVDCALAPDYDNNGAVDGADFLTIIDSTALRGIINVQRTSDLTKDIRLEAIANQTANASYAVRASKQPCGMAHHPSDTVLGWSWGGTNSGSFYRRSQITHDTAFEDWASTRIFVNGAQVACGPTFEGFAP